MATNADYQAVCERFGENTSNFEECVLQGGGEFLPPCARAVLRGEDATPEYWDFLIAQLIETKLDHDLTSLLIEGHQ